MEAAVLETAAVRLVPDANFSYTVTREVVVGLVDEDHPQTDGATIQRIANLAGV